MANLSGDDWVGRCHAGVEAGRGVIRLDGAGGAVLYGVYCICVCIYSQIVGE